MTRLPRRDLPVLVSLLWTAAVAPSTCAAWTECVVLTTDTDSSANVSLMERYDPLLDDSFKTYHITQWQLKDGDWVI